MNTLPASVLALLVVACTSTPPASPTLDSQLQELAGLLVGDYASPTTAGVLEDRPVYLRIRRVTPPPGYRLALYSEMRHDDAQGPLYRQRLYLFDESPQRERNYMRALSFEDAAAAARLVDDPDLMRHVGLRTTDTLGPGCVTTWRQDGNAFIGRVDPVTCEITGKRGDRRRIEAMTRITAESIGQLERGFDLQGKQLFGTVGDALHVWPRVR